MSDKRRYSDRREYLIEAVKKRRKKIRQMAIDHKGGKCQNCHREVHSGLQLPREIVVEKSGEIKEALVPYFTENGNPEPSPVTLNDGREGAETRASARTPGLVRGKRPTPSVWFTRPGDEIVQAQKKFWGSCNH